MQIKVILYGNLRAIYSEMPEEMVLEVEKESSIIDILEKLEISPLVVTKVLVNDDIKDKTFSLTKENSIVELIGPLAGG